MKDHELNYEKTSFFTSQIDDEIDLLKGRMKTYKDITEAINIKFDSNFKIDRIKYRVAKLTEETKGKAHQDAYDFIKMASDNVKNYGGYFAFDLKRNILFERCVYLSKTMLTYAEYFLDVILVDSTYRRNRFNLVLVNVLGVNNNGKSIMLAFALLSSETQEDYQWIFSHLKKAWKNKEPKNCITDEDQSIRSGTFSFYS